MIKNKQKVAAALIEDEQGRIMICKRPKDKARANLWEFVGGKVENGETEKQALIRECMEELEIGIDVYDEFMRVDHHYPDIDIELILLRAKIREGEPVLKEHQDLKFIRPEEVDCYEFCPADTEILEEIKKRMIRQA